MEYMTLLWLCHYARGIHRKQIHTLTLGLGVHTFQKNNRIIFVYLQ